MRRVDAAAQIVAASARHGRTPGSRRVRGCRRSPDRRHGAGSRRSPDSAARRRRAGSRAPARSSPANRSGERRRPASRRARRSVLIRRPRRRRPRPRRRRRWRSRASHGQPGHRTEPGEARRRQRQRQPRQRGISTGAPRRGGPRRESRPATRGQAPRQRTGEAGHEQRDDRPASPAGRASQDPSGAGRVRAPSVRTRATPATRAASRPDPGSFRAIFRTGAHATIRRPMPLPRDQASTSARARLARGGAIAALALAARRRSSPTPSRRGSAASAASTPATATGASGASRGSRTRWPPIPPASSTPTSSVPHRDTLAYSENNIVAGRARPAGLPADRQPLRDAQPVDAPRHRPGLRRRLRAGPLPDARHRRVDRRGDRLRVLPVPVRAHRPHPADAVLRPAGGDAGAAPRSSTHRRSDAASASAWRSPCRRWPAATTASSPAC